jgi:hypothetical protein
LPRAVPRRIARKTNPAFAPIPDCIPSPPALGSALVATSIIGKYSMSSTSRGAIRLVFPELSFPVRYRDRQLADLRLAVDTATFSPKYSIPSILVGRVERL